MTIKLLKRTCNSWLALVPRKFSQLFHAAKQGVILTKQHVASQIKTGVMCGSTMSYRQPKSLFERKIDEQGKELYLVSIHDNGTVLCAYGRNAHSSGCKIVTWEEFLQGDMNDLVEKTMGKPVLQEVLEKLKLIT